MDRMKLTALGLLLCVVATASALFTPWATGKEYVYRLHAISLSDIPELGAQSAGIKFDLQLIVHCRDANTIVVKLIDVTASSFHTNVDNGWDLLESNLGTSVNIDGKMYLERPFVIRQRDGLFESMSVSQDEPLWSVNMKRAVASKLQLHVSGSRSVESATRNFGLNVASDEVNAVFKVLEDDITGECETLYEIAPLSDALVRSDSKLNPLPELCTQGSYFQIVKTKDYSKCRIRPILNVIAPSGWNCKPGASTCSTAVSRSSVSRYIACGSRESFTLLKHTHQGELRTNPYGYDTEQLRDFSVMKIVLQAVRPISPLSKDIDVTLIINSLVFSFAAKVTDARSADGGRMRMPPLRDVDKTNRMFNFADLRLEIRQMLEGVEREMAGHGDVAAKGVIDTISSISRLIRYLDYQEIMTLVNDATNNSNVDESGQPSNLIRTMLLDAIMAAGSNPAVMFLKESIANQRLSRTESVQALSGLPLYIRTPTPELLNELLNLLKMTSIEADRTIFHVATLAVSKLVHTACVNVTEARTRFPVELYGNFCSADDPVIVSKLVPFLGREISGSGRVEDKMVALTALGEVGHESIIPVVVPVIEGKVDYSPMIRTKAVISLHKLAHDSNERVIHILSTIFQNPSESSEVRMAAFTLLILANPPAFRWQKMAVSTWFEPSAQVASFVYTTLYSLANDALPLENLKDVSEKAQAVLPLVKPVPIGLKYSYNLKWSNVIPERNAGAEFHSELFNSEESLLPKSFYSRLSWALGPYHFDVFELEAYAENLKNAWDRIWAKFFKSGADVDQADETRAKNPRFPEFEWHLDLQRMKKQLNAKIPNISEDSGTPEAFIHLSLMKAIHRYASLDEEGFREVIQGLSRVRQLLEGEGTSFKWQKWMPLSNAEVLMPNTLGFLVTTRVHAQVLTSFRGNVKSAPADPSDLTGKEADPAKVQRSQFGPSFSNPSVEMKIKPMLMIKLLAKMAVDVGFTRYLTVAGVDTHLMITVPGLFKAGLDLENWKLLLSWKPTTSELSKLYHFQVRPFTSLVMNTDVQPVTINPNTRDVSATGSTLQTEQNLLGDKLGLKLLYQKQSELPIAKETWMRVPSAYNWLTSVNFALLPASLHRRFYTLTLDPTTSETKKIIFYINFDAADKTDSGTKVYRSGSKSLMAAKDTPDRLHVISNNVEHIVLRKLTKVLNIVKKGTAVHVDAKLIMDGESPKVYGASFAGAYGTEGTKLALNTQIDFPLNEQVTEPFTLCMEGDGTYPWLPALERQALIDTPLEAKWSARIGFGSTCVENQITVNADLKRSDEFALHIKESTENRDCEMYEAQGEVSHDKCLIVKDLAFVLDEYDINIQYSNMTPGALNASLGLERFLKAWFYPHVSDNEVNVQNEEKKVRILAKVHDSLDAVNVMVFKPRSNTFYYNVPLSPVVNVVFPLSARASVTERITDYTISDGYAPTCRLEKNSITTFDRVQYNAQLNDCDHVVLAAPGTDTIGVLMRQEGERKIVTLLVGKDKLEVDALAKVIRYNDIDVVVSEDQPMAIHDDQGLGHIAGIYKIGLDTFKMTTPVFGVQIVTDGKSVTIKAPRSFQGRLIGLCGNMDGETVSELRDPRQCILTSGPIMAASYLLTDTQGKCSGIAEDIRNQLRQEQADCVKYVPYPHPISGGSPDGGSCSVQRTVVVFRGNRTCFSTLTITECRGSCQPIDTMAKNIGFHCIEDPKLAKIMEQEAQNRPMSSMVGKREDFRHTIYAPTGCQAK